MLTPKRPPRDFRVSARENSTKNCLYRFKWNLGGRNLADFASNSPRSLGQENSSILMTYSGCAGSPKPTCLSLQFLRKCRVILPNCRDPRRLIPAEGPRISMGWIGLALIQGAGRPSFHSREGRFRNTAPLFFGDVHAAQFNVRFRALFGHRGMAR